MTLGLLLCLWSALVPAQTTALGLEYAQVDGISLRLDLFRPADAPAAGAPVVLWVHGGGWCSGARSPLAAYAAALPAEGIAVAAVSYRLTSSTPTCANAAGVDWPAPLHDLKAAVRWLRANAAVHGLDPARIAVWGQSAGAHLALSLALTAGDPALEGGVGNAQGSASSVIAVAAYFPPTDLFTLGEDFARTPPGLPGWVATVDGPGQPHAHLIGFGGVGEGIGVLRAQRSNPAPPWPERVAAALSASPLQHVGAGDPPVYLLHGLADTTVPIGQSRRLQEALATAGVPHVYREIAGLGHVPPGDSESALVRRWLAEQFSAVQNPLLRDGFEARP